MSLKCKNLRTQTTEQLTSKLAEANKELLKLRISKTVSGRDPKQISRYQIVRKDVARILAVVNEQQKKAYLEKCDKKALPKAFRPKLTRAIRRELTPEQKGRKVIRILKRQSVYPALKFTLKQ